MKYRHVLPRAKIGTMGRRFAPGKNRNNGQTFCPGQKSEQWAGVLPRAKIGTMGRRFAPGKNRNNGQTFCPGQKSSATQSGNVILGGRTGRYAFILDRRRPAPGGAGQVVSMRDDQGDDIAAALDRLHAGGCSIGDIAFFVEGGGLVHVVTGSNGENMIRARRAPRRDVGRSTGPWRSVCCRGGLSRRCRAGDRCARPGQPLQDHRVLDRIRRHFRFQRTLRGCRSFSRSSRPRTGPSATDRPSRPQADLRSGSRAQNPGPLSFS